MGRALISMTKYCEHFHSVDAHLMEFLPIEVSLV